MGRLPSALVLMVVLAGPALVASGSEPPRPLVLAAGLFGEGRMRAPWLGRFDELLAGRLLLAENGQFELCLESCLTGSWQARGDHGRSFALALDAEGREDLELQLEHRVEDEVLEVHKKVVQSAMELDLDSPRSQLRVRVDRFGRVKLRGRLLHVAYLLGDGLRDQVKRPRMRRYHLRMTGQAIGRS